MIGTPLYREECCALHVEILGRGEPLVMLHGWGMHAGLLRTLATGLALSHEVYLIDLPGHGKSPMSDSFDVSSLLNLIGRCVPCPADWLGWSLGGLIALAMAQHAPKRVRSLVMLSSSPCFVARPDWPGVEKAALEGMAQDLLTDSEATLKRFLSLQTFGYSEARGLYRRLETYLSSAPAPSPEALQGGLRLLLESDFRVPLRQLRLPMLWVLGGRDRLVPAALAPLLRAADNSATVHVFPEAAHVPFLTDLEQLLELLSLFYRQKVGIG